MRMGLSLTSFGGSAPINFSISECVTSVAGSGGAWATVERAISSTRAISLRLIIEFSFRPRRVSYLQKVPVGSPAPRLERRARDSLAMIYAPGHRAGQVALLWRPGRMLF